MLSREERCAPGISGVGPSRRRGPIAFRGLVTAERVTHSLVRHSGDTESGFILAIVAATSLQSGWVTPGASQSVAAGRRAAMPEVPGPSITGIVAGSGVSASITIGGHLRRQRGRRPRSTDSSTENPSSSGSDVYVATENNTVYALSFVRRNRRLVAPHRRPCPRICTPLWGHHPDVWESPERR